MKKYIEESADVKIEYVTKISLVDLNSEFPWYITLVGPDFKPSFTSYFGYRTIFDLNNEFDKQKVNDIINEYNDITFLKMFEG
jgi:hypothetical protein